MVSFVIGGSASGKSACAEHLALSALGGTKRNVYYLATMQVLDEEDEKKVDRHRILRADKGFLTIEQPVAIHRALEHMQAGEKTVLLECISSLTANEMFMGGKIKSEEEVVENVMESIRLLEEGTEDLVIVGCNVFEDGGAYEEEAMGYIRAMGKINREIAAMAHRVVEMVVGIPVIVKGEEIR